MIDYLYRLVFGWVEILLVGDQTERVISRMALSGHRLWKVRRRKEGIQALTSLASIPALRTAVRMERVRVRFGRRGGIPFQWRRIRRRPFLWVGLVTAVLILWYGTSRVWVVDAMSLHLSSSARQELILAAEQSGLRPGTPRARLNIPVVRARMQKRLPQYSWIGINVRGMVATIDAVKLISRPGNHLVPNLVAARSGRVTSVFVYIGQPEVSPGDFVKRGQTLIRGVISGTPATPNGTSPPSATFVAVPAEGQVKADVVYRTKVFQPFRSVQERKTGRRWVQDFLIVNKSRPIQLTGFGPIPYAHYVMRRKMMTVHWVGVNLPIEMLKIVYNETTERSVLYGRQKVLRIADQKASKKLQGEVPRGIRLPKENPTIKWTSKGVWVNLAWTVNQNIAQKPGGHSGP